MFRLWGRIYQLAPVFAIYLMLSSSSDATEIPKNKEINFNKPDKISLKIADRQANFADNFSLKSNQINLLITQVNNIEQLNDIKPTDWSYEALKSLIERYGCIEGFPKRTQVGEETLPNVSSQAYRGQQSVTRAEFVAGLNACLNKIEKTIALSQDVAQTDVETVLRLMQEFQTELAILQGRTDGSRARLDDLSATQFSTTTKLRGEAIIGLGSIVSGNSENNTNNTILGSRLRLELATSFQGNDLLFTRLSRNGFPGFESAIATWQGNLAFAEPDDDDFELDALHYSSSIGDRFDFIIGAAGIDADDIAPTINVLDGDGGSGAISDLRNPLYYPPRDAGLGITHRPVERIEISAGYLASPANESSSGSGLFNGPYSALGQITVTPFPSLNLSATYVHSYNQSDTETGTNRANLRSRTAELFGQEVPTISNSYGLELSWAISDRLVIGGWGGLSKVSNLSTLNQQIDRGTQDIWNWAATLAIPDLGKEGSLAGIVVGSEPKVTNSTSTIDNLQEDSEQSLHLEAFYQYQVNDNIAITPGVVWITKPDTNTPDLDDLVIGTIRTTFSF